MNITLMTIGSRGDVQPFLALAIALRERGHSVMLAAPSDFELLFKAYDIPYSLLPLSAKEIIDKYTFKRGMTPATMLTIVRKAHQEIRRAVRTTPHIFAEAAQNADLLIAHGFVIPFAYAIHQHLKVPLVLGIAAPVVSTQVFPSPMFPSLSFGGRFYNPLTYSLLVRLALSYQMGAMHAYCKEVGLPKLSGGNVVRLLTNAEFPILMHYSKHLMPIPSDWNANVHVTGAWTMPSPDDWTPPDSLSAFLAQGDPPVFFGFGSMPVGNPAKMAQTISDALRLTGLRGVLQAGWAGLAHEDEHLITISDAPHDWLFPHMAAVVHHGGSGTTHSALRAGKPALIVPFSADQPMWGRRLAELGVNVPPIKPRKLTPDRLADALRTLTQDNAMRNRAAELGAMLRAEDGLAATCALVERYGSKSS
jgi:sterol 3beta-glucosyltransferase